ncbi:hypothetical protein [Neisseria shayeganii]|uniref:Uncharacterized protein n=1 Tax=Neisseria shayeganii TaxID=607712 RepID=A0A7D7NCD3_9NEIS|nr:hypothetical protein [Neisseria shayeganii]QMT41275.1 hypothetical protein H3L94_04410 [Neisseria shayeganii]
MRIIDSMSIFSAETLAAEALFEKGVSTMAETRVMRVFAAETDASGQVTKYKASMVTTYHKAKHGETKQTSGWKTYGSAAEMRAAVKEFFADLELLD